MIACKKIFSLFLSVSALITSTPITFAGGETPISSTPGSATGSSSTASPSPPTNSYGSSVGQTNTSPHRPPPPVPMQPKDRSNIQRSSTASQLSASSSPISRQSSQPSFQEKHSACASTTSKCVAKPQPEPLHETQPGVANPPSKPLTNSPAVGPAALTAAAAPVVVSPPESTKKRTTAPRSQKPSSFDTVRIAVISYSNSRWKDVFNGIGGKVDDHLLPFAQGESPTNHRHYKMEFIEIPGDYDPDTVGRDPESYILKHQGLLQGCSGCIFFYDLHRVCKNPGYDDKKPHENWEFRDYGNVVQEECRRLCHAVKKMNPKCYFLLIHDLERFEKVNMRAWHNYACSSISDYCERTWINDHPHDIQFVDAMGFPINKDMIFEQILTKIPTYCPGRFLSFISKIFH